MRYRAALAVTALAAALAQCDTTEEGADGDAGRVAVAVAPLSLTELTDACYELTVANEAGETVWSRADLCASAYGSPSGDLAYVGTCDATDDDGDGTALNTVTLTITSLSDAGGPLSDWRDPCVGGCVQEAACAANADVAVTFDLTVMRAATQGFFDIAVNFDDLFCSAKVDCEDPGGDPITLVHGPDGARVPSVVWALTCTDGDAGPDIASRTHLYMDPVVLDCDGTLYVVEPWAGPGNLYPGGVGAPAPYVQAMTFRGTQTLSNGLETLDAVYWNVALGLDLDFFAALAGGSCTLKTRATASRGPLVDGQTPAGSVYPYIDVSVPLYAGGAFTCTQHPLDGAPPNDGVASAYVGDAAGVPPIAFGGYARLGAAGVESDAVDPCVVCAAEAICTPAGDPVCACPDGTFGDGFNCTLCTAIAHCAGTVTCTDAADSACDVCEAGYEGPSCTDIDECLTDNGGCSPYATCTNTDGGRTCACDAGFTGDGVTCTATVVTGAFTAASPGRWADETYATSCETYIRPAAPKVGSTTSGVYLIDPDGDGVGVAPYQVYCDMGTDGGGWTLVAKVHRQHLDAAVDEPDGWFRTLRDEASLLDATSYADRIPGQASHGSTRLTPLGAVSSLSRFIIIAEDDVNQTGRWFKAMSGDFMNWMSTTSHTATQVCTDTAMTANCSTGTILSVAGDATWFYGMNLAQWGYPATCEIHMRQNGNGSDYFDALCSCTGNANSNQWHDDAIDGHWGNGLSIWLR